MATFPTGQKPFPHFGRTVAARLDRLHLNNREAAEALGVTPEMVRRYREGLVMPRDAKLEKLATLLGMTAAELRYGGKARPGGREAIASAAALSLEERELLDVYRGLPPFARKAARLRLQELLEEFGAPSPANPYGRG